MSRDMKLFVCMANLKHVENKRIEQPESVGLASVN